MSSNPTRNTCLVFDQETLSRLLTPLEFSSSFRIVHFNPQISSLMPVKLAFLFLLTKGSHDPHLKIERTYLIRCNDNQISACYLKCGCINVSFEQQPVHEMSEFV